MSKAGSVRGEGRTVSQANGDVDHEIRNAPIPDYVDQERSHLNSIIIPPKRGAELKTICETRRGKRDTKRKMKSNACVSQSILISFGREIQPAFDALPIEVQDKLYQKLMQKIADEANTDVSGLVAHRDETAPHAHGQLIGYSRDGTPLTKIMNRAFRRDMQDWMVEIFKPHLPEIERGVRKSVRLAQGDDASKTIHKSVAELHGSLLPQIEETKAELARLKEEQATIEKRIAKLRAKEELTAKQTRNLEAYERRLQMREEAVVGLEAEAERLKKLAAELEERETSVAAGEKRLEELPAREEKLEERESAVRQAEQSVQDLRATEQDLTASVAQKETELETLNTTVEEKKAEAESIIARAHEKAAEIIAAAQERIEKAEASFRALSDAIKQVAPSVVDAVRKKYTQIVAPPKPATPQQNQGRSGPD